jgi:phage gp46-like protein
MDFATILSPNLTFDWAVAAGDLAGDGSLVTPVALSLFLDRVANDDDIIPDGSGDRRGSWIDAYLPPLPNGMPDHLGSRLWLLARAKQIQETLNLAEAYGYESLQWMELDGVAQSVICTASWAGLYKMKLSNRIARIGPNGGVTNHQYDFLWNMSLNQAAVSGIAIGSTF